MSGIANVFFSSDWHLGHKKIQQFCPTTRCESTVEEMNEMLIEQHNKHVKPGDLFFHLGDFTFMNAEETEKALKRMNGVKKFIAGNHDSVFKKNRYLREMLDSYKDYEFVRVRDKKVALFHYPIESWQEQHHGALHLHGHVHGNTSYGRASMIKNRLDVGIDNRPNGDMAPFHLDEILDIMKVQNDYIDRMKASSNDFMKMVKEGK